MTAPRPTAPGPGPVVSVLLWLMAAGMTHAAPARPPNIVVILADDLGINDLSCYGRRDQPTPNIDRLAAQGLRFTAGYAQPLCSPTRATLMTGFSAARLRITTYLPGRPDAPSQLLLQPEIAGRLPADTPTLAARLKAVGYVTACLGKWHLGDEPGARPVDRGFDVVLPGRANTTPSATEGGKGEYELTARAERFMAENRDRPFFLYLCHNTPHVPLAAKPGLVEKHADAFNPTYAAMLETLDDCVGRVVARVDDLGLAEKTLVVFMSDNGGLHVPEGKNTPSTHNTPYRAGKGFCYEGGIRVPVIARWTGTVKPGQTAEPVTSLDWTPTAAALAGAAGGGFEGTSLVNLLARGEAIPLRPLFWHQPHYTNQGGRPAGAARLGDRKLIEHYEDGRCELFDLSRDPGETADLSAAEPGRVADLRGRLEKWRRDVAAQGMTANPGFNPRLWQRLYADVDVSRRPPAARAAEPAAELADWRALMGAVLPRPRATGRDDPRPEFGPGPGAVILHARDAAVHGTKLRYEPEPHKDTLGFWVQPDDWAEWSFKAPGTGVFDVQVLQGCGQAGGSEVVVSVGDQRLTFMVQPTGHFQRFVPRTVGHVALKAGDLYTLAVRPRTKSGGAVMDLRRVVLRAKAVER